MPSPRYAISPVSALISPGGIASHLTAASRWRCRRRTLTTIDGHCTLAYTRNSLVGGHFLASLAAGHVFARRRGKFMGRGRGLRPGGARERHVRAHGGGWRGRGGRAACGLRTHRLRLCGRLVRLQLCQRQLYDGGHLSALLLTSTLGAASGKEVVEKCLVH